MQAMMQAVQNEKKNRAKLTKCFLDCLLQKLAEQPATINPGLGQPLNPATHAKSTSTDGT